MLSTKLKDIYIYIYIYINKLWSEINNIKIGYIKNEFTIFNGNISFIKQLFLMVKVTTKKLIYIHVLYVKTSHEPVTHYLNKHKIGLTPQLNINYCL